MVLVETKLVLRARRPKELVAHLQHVTVLEPHLNDAVERARPRALLVGLEGPGEKVNAEHAALCVFKLMLNGVSMNDDLFFIHLVHLKFKLLKPLLDVVWRHASGRVVEVDAVHLVPHV